MDGTDRDADSWRALVNAEAETRELWLKLWLEEFKSLRSESEQSRASQQAILQWSLASFAAITAAGLIAFRTSGGVGATTGQGGSLLLILFGLGMPGLAFFAYLVWWGEFKRMERAGRYLRGMEGVAWLLVNRGVSGHRLPPPLHWESYLGARPAPGEPRKRSTPKIVIGYFGTAAIYGGFVVASLGIFCSLVLSHKFIFASDRWTKIVFAAWAVLMVSGFAAVTGYLYRSAYDAARSAEPPWSSIESEVPDVGREPPAAMPPGTAATGASLARSAPAEPESEPTGRRILRLHRCRLKARANE